MTTELPQKIGKFFVAKEKDLFQYLSENESKLLSLLSFMKELKLLKDSASENALFGWDSLKSDFRPERDKNTIIEVKYIRQNRSNNECDIKNGLSQIIEQAVCKEGVLHAIFVVIDAGRASKRDWNAREKMFISMFKKNPFDIQLSVVRIQLDKKNEKVSYAIV